MQQSSEASSKAWQHCVLDAKPLEKLSAAAPTLLRYSVTDVQVDEIYINTIREYGLYDSIWQAFAVFLPVRSVGVQARHRILLSCSVLSPALALYGLQWEGLLRVHPA